MHKSLPLPNVIDFIMQGIDAEMIAQNMLAAANRSVIQLKRKKGYVFMSKDNVKYIKLADTVINKLKNRTDKKSVEMKFKAGVPGLTESKVGGMPFIPAGGDYPGFTQYDPRDEDSDEVLLLQIDSFDVDGEWFLMWGDAGIANFFIKPEDLKNRNFTRVNYNWDCS